MTDRKTLPCLHEVKDALKDLLENAGLTRSQRRKIGDLLGCETEFGFRSLAAKYNIGISYDEDNVYVTFYGKNEEFEKPKALIGKKTPWRRFFPQSSQPTEKRRPGSCSSDDLIAQLETVDLSTIEIDRNTDPENAFDTLVKQLRKQGVKFTKPLANAIKQTKFHREIVRSKTWLQDLIDFLQANRVFLEKSILRDAFYLLFLSLLKMFPLSCRRFSSGSLSLQALRILGTSLPSERAEPTRSLCSCLLRRTSSTLSLQRRGIADTTSRQARRT